MESPVCGKFSHYSMSDKNEKMRTWKRNAFPRERVLNWGKAEVKNSAYIQDSSKSHHRWGERISEGKAILK